MFDVLVYLFENYLHAGAFPEGELLNRKLTAAGFEQDEIDDALNWLTGLRETSAAAPVLAAPSATSVRVFTPDELACLSPECLNFLAFLANSGNVDPLARELIIERATAVNGPRITLARFKVIVLMVLWQQEQPMDTLILDELLDAGSDDDGVPFLH